MSTYQTVLLDIRDNAAYVTFNRPEKRNCMSPTLHAEMCKVLDEIEKARCKVIVLTGAGDAFCAGMDLEQCFLEPFDKPELMAEINTNAFGWFTRIKKISAVTIGKVNGWCFGGGMALAGVLDIVIAADESTWGLSEINFGIFPGGGTTWAYANNMPSRKKALYYALTGETFTGKRAHDLGYATKSVPLAQLDAETDRVVKMLTRLGRVVLGKTKEVYEKVLDMDFEVAIDYEMAKMWELSRETNDDWVRTALVSFKKREFKPGLQSYELKRDV
ncbi:p-hydroxycinnamoyl CoA hydratase/lyase [Immundisolibacter cernigliae]|uniref:p-hydroxycinnamoyl CoA hydratase/lyase n=1 Tax=Immundisolibacter cernigliae TaxID=1810504 RepID=A0A1B1YX17_9GAMM|nr:p-hydroxycinnamoyl CoA hydratase/lyase [Immundisolibacter cernigliae]ANX05256.1 p-hydroxycinnamoyl CoA hydratase/lyase [Immundisolibacter cernigliae]